MSAPNHRAYLSRKSTTKRNKMFLKHNKNIQKFKKNITTKHMKKKKKTIITINK